MSVMVPPASLAMICTWFLLLTTSSCQKQYMDSIFISGLYVFVKRMGYFEVWAWSHYHKRAPEKLQDVPLKILPIPYDTAKIRFFT
jgi:hypothetical protein